MTRPGVCGIVVVLAWLLAGAAHGQSSLPPIPEISFQSSREGEFIFAEARVDLPVSPAMVWSVLTDYENYPRFISSMRESKIVTRNADGVVVDQAGSVGFLFFSMEMSVRLLIAEFPPSVVVARGIEGSFRDSLGRYELRPRGSGTRLIYNGRFLPDFFVPPLIGMNLVDYLLHRNFAEVVAEILRRDTAAR